jgi:hypothetical protein
MLPLRWILPIVALLFAIALIPLAFKAPERPRPQMASLVSQPAPSMKMSDRPGSQQATSSNAGSRRDDTIAAPIQPDAAGKTGDAQRNQVVSLRADSAVDRNDKDVTGTVQLRDTADQPALDGSSAIEFPAGAAPVISKPRSVRRVRHVRRLAKAPTAPQQDFSQFSAGNQQAKLAPTTETNNSFASPQAQAPAPKSKNSFARQQATPAPEAQSHFASQQAQTTGAKNKTIARPQPAQTPVSPPDINAH